MNQWHSQTRCLPVPVSTPFAPEPRSTFKRGLGEHVGFTGTAFANRLRHNPDDIPAMVEEALRWDPPIQCTFRRATRDDRIEGVEVKAGEMVIPMWAGANWDPQVFPNPEQFDIDRPSTKPHMGFGFGPHFCTGAELARIEARVAFEELLGRVDEITLDEAASDLTHLPSFASHGYQKIGLRFSRRL